MLGDEEKRKLVNRLRRISGQVGAVERLVDEGAYCVDILTQISAAIGALNRVGQIVLENHLQTCVSDAMGKTPEERQQKLSELVEIFRRYGRAE